MHSRSQVWLYWSTIVSSNGNSTRLGLRTTERCGCVERLTGPTRSACPCAACCTLCGTMPCGIW